MKFLTSLVLALTILSSSSSVLAQGTTISPSPEATAIVSPEATEIPRVDITQKSEEVTGPLETLIRDQRIGNVWPFNPIKYAIKNAVESGVPANTIVLLLLLPIVATVMAATRQIIGIRGFGIFLPAALSIAFVAIGPILGILLFMAIVVISTSVRLITRKLKLKLQYLPRMALILWFVSFGILGILFASPLINYPALKNVSIFPVLILTLLTEDFTRIQLGKSFKTAIRLTTQTLFLAIISYVFLTYQPFRSYVLLNPEIVLISTFLINIVLGKYVGLRFMEYLRFQKLISSK
ncbi:MAG: 7TM domain-containing protein [bacterium]|nr:MAG: 7TM domain-containing protein [bacterium]